MEELLKYIISYALYLAHYDAYFQMNDDAKKCRYLSVTNNFIFSYISFKLLSHEALFKRMLCHGHTNKIICFSN